MISFMVLGFGVCTCAEYARIYNIFKVDACFTIRNIDVSVKNKAKQFIRLL